MNTKLSNNEESQESSSLQDAFEALNLEKGENYSEKYEKSWDHSLGSIEHQPPQRQAYHQLKNKPAFLIAEDRRDRSATARR